MSSAAVVVVASAGFDELWFSDILWSDPEEEKEGVAVFKSKDRTFVPNDVSHGCFWHY